MHQRRAECRTDHCGVDKYRNRKSEPDHLHDNVPGKGERSEHRDHDERRAGDHGSGVGQAFADAARIVAGFIEDGSHPAEQEDFVVHAQPEKEAEDEERNRNRHHFRRRFDSEEFGSMAELEDENDDSIARGHRTKIEDNGLGGRQRRSEQEEQGQRRHA